MRFLLDANIFLEAILLQEKAEDVQLFLGNENSLFLYVSDFSLHSIGYILFQRNRHQAWQEFMDDIIDRLGIQVLSLQTTDLKRLPVIAKQYTLDFDDAYQYTVADKYDLTIVSFDTDFNRTPRRAVTPGMVLGHLESQNLSDQDNTTK